MPLPRDYFTLNDDQFAKLVELLTPGYQLSQAYLAELHQRRTVDAQRQAEDAAKAEADERGRMLSEENARTAAREQAEADALAADRRKQAEIEARQRAEAQASEEEREAALRSQHEADVAAQRDGRVAEQSAVAREQRTAAETAEFNAEAEHEQAMAGSTAKRQLTPGT
jgi:membrane protein involved in colicin uptake